MSDKKIEQFWRNATAADVARVMAGENVYARFRDRYADGWAEYYLSGVNGKNWIAGNFRWDLCQVYDPPQWWLDKPDPGEGWRLLKKFPDELKLATDEGWFPDGAKWCPVESDNGIQLEGYWYRRRIEAEKVVESKPLLIRRRVIEIGDEVKLPNGQVLVFNGEGFEVY